MKLSGLKNPLTQKQILILAIETSCDETAAAVLKYSPSLKNKNSNQQSQLKIKPLSFVVKSQIPIHAKTGGVIPEAAARAHIKNIRPVITKALTLAKCSLKNIDYIAVTVGPGLIPSLLVGVEFAKTLSLAANKPIIPVNHLLGHLYSPLKQSAKTAIFPQIALIVSGGHTILVLMQNEKKYKVLGQTVDDAAGEAFDKVARILGLPYPGGPEISKMAALGKNTVNFPRPMLNQKNYNFSFSGLKTAVVNYLKTSPLPPGNLTAKANICASFENAVVDVLSQKTLRAALQFKAKSISLSGGVSANNNLRNILRKLCQKNNLKFFAPSANLSTDNAEMIGLAAAFMLKNGFQPVNYKNIKADPNLKL